MVTLRLATVEEDWARLFWWRNDPATREASLDREPVALEDHLGWLGRACSGKAGLTLYVARDPLHESPVGTGRIDRAGKGKAELSVTVSPACRGRGYGEAIVRALLAKLDGGTTVVARVRESNWSSLCLFATCGFDVRRVTDGVVELSRKV